MTREEAIKIINCYDIGFYDLSGEKIPADKLADAFDMAIEALKEKKDDDSLLTDSAKLGKENECKLSREDARYFLQGISDMFSLSPEAEMSIDMAIEALQTKTIRCEECKHHDECEEVVLFEVNDEEVMGHRLHWCSYAERKEL